MTYESAREPPRRGGFRSRSWRPRCIAKRYIAIDTGMALRPPVGTRLCLTTPSTSGDLAILLPAYRDNAATIHSVAEDAGPHISPERLRIGNDLLPSPLTNAGDPSPAQRRFTDGVWARPEWKLIRYPMSPAVPALGTRATSIP